MIECQSFKHPKIFAAFRRLLSEAFECLTATSRFAMYLKWTQCFLKISFFFNSDVGSYCAVKLLKIAFVKMSNDLYVVRLRISRVNCKHFFLTWSFLSHQHEIQLTVSVTSKLYCLVYFRTYKCIYLKARSVYKYMLHDESQKVFLQPKNIKKIFSDCWHLPNQITEFVVRRASAQNYRKKLRNIFFFLRLLRNEGEGGLKYLRFTYFLHFTLITRSDSLKLNWTTITERLTQLFASKFVYIQKFPYSASADNFSVELLAQDVKTQMV